MGSIHLLEDAVINKIAAGEVVERPASVLKELVENAVDAGATSIAIELEEGGKKRVFVSDNGSGMDREDALLSLKRHATSKIRKGDDLFSIKTMGFRGEALAAISSVSRFTLATVKSDGPYSNQELLEGVKIVTTGDNHPDVRPWNGTPGTSVTVEDLFFNIPARSKFLKSDSTEYAYSLELVQALSLGLSHVEFTLSHNGKEQFRSPATVKLDGPPPFPLGEDCLKERGSAIFGKDSIKKLVYTSSIKSSKDHSALSRYGDIEILLSPPGLEKPTSKFIYIFVNGRWVKDSTTRYAAIRGYQSHLLKGRYPFLIAFLKLDPSLVDVNVHPAKTEVRFQYTKEVQDLITYTIRNSLRDGGWAEMPLRNTDAGTAEPSSLHSQTSFTSNTGQAFSKDFDLETTKNYSSRARDSYFRGSEPKRSIMSFDGLTSSSSGFDRSRNQFIPSGTPIFPDSIPHSQAEPIKPFNWKELRYIGTVDRCYLLFENRISEESEGGLLVIDQHAFHERIIFERLNKNFEKELHCQPLLIPEAIELSPSEISLLEEHQKDLEKAGFRFAVITKPAPSPDSTDSASKRTIVTLELRAIPSLLTGRPLDSIFSDLSDALSGGDHSTLSLGISREILASIACHSAVRMGEELGEKELKQLLHEADQVDFYLNCPHGRRVFKWWSFSEVARWFDR